MAGYQSTYRVQLSGAFGFAAARAVLPYLADLISRPPAWTVRLAGQGAGPVNVEGVAFAYGGHDLNLLAENRDVYFVPAAAYEG